MLSRLSAQYPGPQFQGNHEYEAEGQYGTRKEEEEPLREVDHRELLRGGLLVAEPAGRELLAGAGVAGSARGRQVRLIDGRGSIIRCLDIVIAVAVDAGCLRVLGYLVR